MSELNLPGILPCQAIEALIAGEWDPGVVAGLARGRMKAKHAALIEALTGRFDDHPPAPCTLIAVQNAPPRHGSGTPRAPTLMPGRRSRCRPRCGGVQRRMR